MKFKDYDEILKLNRHHLIESYVKQYGEENRDLIIERFDKIKFCFYENPRKLREYVDTKAIKLGRKFTIEMLKKLGLDSSSTYVNENGELTSKNNQIRDLLKSIFPRKGIINLSGDDGIFSFLPSYDENTEFNLLKKGIVLKSLGQIKELSETKNFIKTDNYKEIKDILIKILSLASNYRMQMRNELNEILQYASDLENKERSIVSKHLEKFINECKEFLNEEDQNNLSLYPKSLDYICDRNSAYGPELFKINMPFEPGLLEYFLDEYTEALKNSTDLEKKEQILTRRLEYLKRIGFDILNLNLSRDELLTKDWYEIKELKLPSQEKIQQLKKIREKYQISCMKELASLYPINDYQFKEDALSSKEMQRFLFTNNSEYICRCITNNGNVEELTVFISPIDANYSVLDVTLDHEIRHGLEYSSEMVTLPNDFATIKAGTPIELLKSGLNFSFYIDGDMIGHSNLNINEIMTQKLSKESTEDRYRRGIYILTPKEEATLKYTSDYDQYIPNFDAVFTKEMQEVLIQSKFNKNGNFPILGLIPQEVLTRINDLIIDNSPASQDELNEIKENLRSTSGIKF